MKLVTIFPLLVFILAGNGPRAWTETFGACSYTDFVAQAVGICEKRFYTDLANDLQADCREEVAGLNAGPLIILFKLEFGDVGFVGGARREPTTTSNYNMAQGPRTALSPLYHSCSNNIISTSYKRMSTCYLKKTRECLEGHYSEAQIERLAKVTLLIQRYLGASQWYCSNKPTNISSLDPSVRALIPCTDELFTEGHKCTGGFRETFNTNRNDPSLCMAFSRSRSCTQSVFDRYCNGTVPVPTENRFNPFCTDPGNETIIAFQASKKPKNDTEILSKPRQPTASGARRNIRVLSRMLSMAVGVVNLTNVVRSLVLN